MLLSAIVSFNDVWKVYLKKKNLYYFITNHSQKAFSHLETNQHKLPRLPWQHANYSAPCSAHPECQLWQSSSNMHIDVLQAVNPYRNVRSELRGGSCLCDQLWMVKYSVCSRWQRLTPVLAYRSIPQATTNHCICSLQTRDVSDTQRKTCHRHSREHAFPVFSAVLITEEGFYVVINLQVLFQPESRDLLVLILVAMVWDDIRGWCCRPT